MSEITKENPLGMRSLSEQSALGIAETFKKNIFQLDWIFDKWYEKLILALMMIWSFYNIWRLF